MYKELLKLDLQEAQNTKITKSSCNKRRLGTVYCIVLCFQQNKFYYLMFSWKFEF